MTNRKENFFSTSLGTVFILLGLMLVMLYFRIVPLHHIVFTDWPGIYGNFVNFVTDDAVYHMRLVHNTLAHFPHRIFFDPFTHYPYGSQVHFGPFFTLLIASLAWLLGLGHPTPMLVNTVGAYVPPVLAALCIIPTYFIGKKIFGRNAGILAAAFLAFITSEFFMRSVLGFTDHHVAEVLYSTMIFAFLTYAFSYHTERKFNKMVLCAFFAGISFALYLLNWSGAYFVGAILLVFFIWEIVFAHLHKEKSGYLCAIATFTYLIPAILVLPYALDNQRFQYHYSLTQPVALVSFLLIILIVYAFARLFNLTKRRTLYPIFLVGIFLFSVFAIKNYLPNVYNLIASGVDFLFNPGAAFRTISELWPIVLDRNTEHLTFNLIWQNFFFAFPMAFIATTTIFLNKIKRKDGRAARMLFVWSIVMCLATISECRYAYYFAINVVLLAGYLGIEVFTYLKNLVLSGRIIKNEWMQFIISGFLVAALIIVVIFPQTKVSPKGDAPYFSGPRLTKEWYDAYVWLKQHTPNPEGDVTQPSFDYHRGYFEIPKNITERYPYPNSAYGIISWWSIGHQLTYIAERIPIANPFQMGIIEANKNEGVAPFFTSQNEEEAVKDAETMGARYVLIDNATASSQYPGMLLWEKNTFIPIKIEMQQYKLLANPETFHKSMLNRLYYFDAVGLNHFRLVYESLGDYIVNAKSFDIKTSRIDWDYKMTRSNLGKMLELSKLSSKPNWKDNAKNLIIYDANPPVKLIKIFEMVKGATIQGEAPSGKLVTLTLTLMTNGGRLIMYTQKTIALHDRYEFVVPYPTRAMLGDNYGYDIVPLTKYIINFGRDEKLVAVSEEDVMNGAVIDN